MPIKPLVSFLIVTYNQEYFIQDAIEGAFSQNYSPMEIIISDDCSTDDTYGVICNMVSRYNGEHKIIINRNESNLGIAGNVNKAMQMANGDIFVLAAGDDQSLPHRVQRTCEIFEQYPSVSCINANSIPCNAALRPLAKTYENNAISIINIYDYLEFTDFVLWSGDTRAIKRELYDIFGPLQKGKDEDSSYFVRSMLFGGGAVHSQEFLSLRRWHGKNVSDFRNIKKHKTEDFVGQPLLDIQTALRKGLVTPELAAKMQWKIRYADRLLADQYYNATNSWYRLLYTKPIDILRRIKNKVFT